RVGISGSYGGLNLGDEAILQVIITELSRARPVEITVFSRNSDDTRSRHSVGRVIPLPELSRTEVLPAIGRLDVLMVAGAVIRVDAEAATFVREAFLAEEIAVPVMFHAIGAGPLERSTNRETVRKCLDEATAITVRERHARQLLEDIGIRQEIRVTA